MGYRGSESGLPTPASEALGPAYDVVHPSVQPRSTNYRALPLGFVPGYGPISCDRADRDTIVRAYRRRVGRDIPAADPGVLARFAAFVSKWVQEHVTPVDVPSFDDWLKGTSYPESRRQELRREYEKHFGLCPSSSECAHVDGFVKAEAYDIPKEARGINSRCDAFKAFSGPFFSALEAQLYKNPWFIKHVPVPERPALIAALARAGMHYYENDYKAFESHFVREFMRVCECVLYEYAFSKYPNAAAFINKVVSGQNRIHMKGGLRFVLEARRMSGDMCTSLGNGFTNLMIVLFIVSEKQGIVSGFVEGDDGLFATDVVLTEEDFRRLGFSVDIKEIPKPTLGHFCGMLCSDQGEVLKDPRRVLRTFFWTSSAIFGGEAVMMALQKSKALSLCYELPNCPILGMLGREALRRCGDVRARTEDGVWKVVPEGFDGPTGPFTPSASARDVFSSKFGITCEAQLAAEEAISQWDLAGLAAILPPTDNDLWYTARYLEVR